MYQERHHVCKSEGRSGKLRIGESLQSTNEAAAAHSSATRKLAAVRCSLGSIMLGAGWVAQDRGLAWLRPHPWTIIEFISADTENSVLVKGCAGCTYPS